MRREQHNGGLPESLNGLRRTILEGKLELITRQAEMYRVALEKILALCEDKNLKLVANQALKSARDIMEEVAGPFETPYPGSKPYIKKNTGTTTAAWVRGGVRQQRRAEPSGSGIKDDNL